MGHMDRNRSGAEETDVSITPPKTWAVDVPAVANALWYPLEQPTVRRTAPTLTLINLDQTKGFDCPGCARPEPDPAHRHRNEYREDGAKHVSDEATSRRITAGFFREHPVSEPAERSTRWLNQQGRLTEPMVERPGSDHYEPIGRDAAPRSDGP